MPLMPLSVMRPILHTMIPLLHTLTPLPYGLKAMIRETVGGTRLSSTSGISTLRALCREVGYPEELCITVCCTALAVLWMALHKEKFSLLATSLQAAAGVTGNQRWALILSSSARVSLVTYTAVIAVHHGFDLSLPTRLMILTDQVTCALATQRERCTSGWLIRGLAGFLIRLQLASLHPLGWNISSTCNRSELMLLQPYLIRSSSIVSRTEEQPCPALGCKCPCCLLAQWVRATAEASSKLPYCCPSSLSATSASSIHLPTGLYRCEHSWWNPPPHPIMTCFPLRTSLL